MPLIEPCPLSPHLHGGCPTRRATPLKVLPQGRCNIYYGRSFHRLQSSLTIIQTIAQKPSFRHPKFLNRRTSSVPARNSLPHQAPPNCKRLATRTIHKHRSLTPQNQSSNQPTKFGKTWKPAYLRVRSRQ